mgnify:CR=1 FL=1
MNLLRNVPISKRLWLIPVVAVVMLFILGMLMIQQVRSDLYRGKQEATRNVVEAAAGVFEHYHKLETSGAMTTADAQQAAIEQIRLLRYDGQDYFWINDLGPKMIMHPMQPKLDGQDLSKIKDPEGKELFNEMIEISAAVKPTQTIMVLDASIGQAAEAQCRAFKEAADYGALFVTKLDGHAKGGGAISAVASSQTPILFIGTGEHIHDLEPFRARPFISKLLGMGDLSGLMDKMEEMHMNEDVQQRQRDMMKKIQEGGTLTIRDWREQITSIMSMGPMSKIAGMIPGMGQMMGGEGPNDQTANQKFKTMLYIIDSMTPDELDSDGSCFTKPIHPGTKTPVRLTARALRVARGSGTSVRDVEEFLMQYRTMAHMVKKVGGKTNWMQQMKGGAPMMPPGMTREQMHKMQQSLPADIKAQLRQPGGREQLMRQLQSGQVPPSLAAMGGLGGMPGMGGMPDLSQMQNMMQGGLGGLMQKMMGGAS